MWRNPKYKKMLFNALNTFDELIVYDLETSGLSLDNDRIIQFAAVKYKIINKKKLEVIEEYCEYINPGFYIRKKTEELTGITNEFLADKPMEEEVFDKIKTFIGDSCCICGYNNNKFDDMMMKKLYSRYNDYFFPSMSLDAFLMGRDIVDLKKLKNFKLSDLITYFNLNEGLTFHNAIDDVKATGLLLEKFIDEYINNPNLIIKDTYNKPIPRIFSISYWEGYTYTQSRVYVSTNYGKIYFHLNYKYWENKDKDIDTISKINMEKLEEMILQQTELDRIEDLHKFKKIGYKKCY